MQTENTSADPAARADMLRSPWKNVLLIATVTNALVLLLYSFLLGEVIPPVLIFVVLAFAGAGLLLWKVRAGAIMLGVFSLLFLLLNLPFIVPALSVPASTVDFVSTCFVLISLVTMIVAAAGLIRRTGGERAAPFATVMAGLAVLVLGVAVVSRIAYGGAAAQPGDVTITTVDIQFDPRTVEADGGEVSVFVDNRDTAFHTFTIEELDVNLQVPGNSTARVTFDAEPGSYEFICVPHQPDMSGTLEVSS